MQMVRSFEAEEEFEKAWDEVSILVRLAREAARRGRLQELEGHLVKLRALVPHRAEDLGRELEALARCVREHPARGARRDD